MTTATKTARTMGFAVVLLGIPALLTWTTWQEVALHIREARDLTTAQALSISDVIAESRRHSLEVYQRWEEETAERLLNNARWVALQDADSEISSEQLTLFAETHNLFRINLFDASGRRVATSHPEVDHPGLTPRHQPRDYLMPILEGRTDTLRIGFKPARFHDGRRFAVAVARPAGGAVVVNIDADELLQAEREISLEHLFEALGVVHGVRYLAIQRGPEVVAASLPEEEIPVWDGPPALDDASAWPATREIETSTGPIFEFAETVTFSGEALALLRIGLDGAALEATCRSIRQHAATRTILFLVSALLASGLLLVWQRQALLGREVRQARSELTAREIEARRAERFVAMGVLASGVAHQIRNPLNTIMMIAQRLERQTVPPDRLGSLVGHIRHESKRIDEHIEQFLELARPRRPLVEALDVGETAQGVARAEESAFAAAGVNLEVRARGIRATLDPRFVTEIIENLLRNAREASAPGDRVVLDVQRRGEVVEISVTDQGCGVPQELRESIFDLYFSTKQGGTGLGLSLVSQMANSMGGTVRLDDEVRQGARFVVTLPRTPAVATARSQSKVQMVGAGT